MTDTSSPDALLFDLCRASKFGQMQISNLKISYYHSISNKKIKGIVHIFPNIIHLDFEKSIDPTGEALKLMVKSYPNLKYINISALYNRFRPKNDIDLTAIANSCHKLEYLNISGYTRFSEIIICNVICSCPGSNNLTLAIVELLIKLSKKLLDHAPN